ncbi:Wzz/FepE/Etk N-terminal domain-containing protein [Sandaracinobacter sp. RS1-74]|uniref:Wzz/FepE/Etk N-terminal domain-containing protein n=1 Tax=Sandaracinobacteroides sayramensis TaxID=2913411 RepID=UPI001EDC36F0|nr:Wzz/FepE/Etk N-terminal domain-containing protein [Sandaracinobacteroides sayramensis]
MQEVFLALGRQWLAMALVLLASLLLALIFLRSAPPKYTSKLLVTTTSSASLGSSEIGGLASLAGIGMPSSDGQVQFETFLEGLKTRETANRLLKADPELLKRIFQAEWDDGSKQWRAPDGMLPLLAGGMKRLIGYDTGYLPPDAARLQGWLENHIEIEKARDQRLTAIQLETADPALGRDILARLHEVVDGLLRQKAIERADTSIAYLNEKLQTVTVAPYREVLVETLAAQEKKRMLASTGLPYAAEPFGPPVSGGRPTSPNPFIVILAALVIGIALAIATALLRERKRLFKGSGN